MDDFPIAPVTYRGGLEEGRRSAICQPWEKLFEPIHKLSCWECLSHAFRLYEGWRKKIVAAGLPSLTIGIVPVPGPSFFSDCFREIGVRDGIGIFHCEQQREGRIRMNAG